MARAIICHFPKNPEILLVAQRENLEFGRQLRGTFYENARTERSQILTRPDRGVKLLRRPGILLLTTKKTLPLLRGIILTESQTPLIISNSLQQMMRIRTVPHRESWSLPIMTRPARESERPKRFLPLPMLTQTKRLPTAFFLTQPEREGLPTHCR